MVGWWSTGASCLDCRVCVSEVLKSRRGKATPGRAWGWLVLAVKVRWSFQAPTKNCLWWYCTPHHSPGHWKDWLIIMDWLIPTVLAWLTLARLTLALRDSSGTQKSLRNLSWKTPTPLFLFQLDMGCTGNKTGCDGNTVLRWSLPHEGL